MTLALDRALTRQSYDGLAKKFVQRWKPTPPDKRRSARSLAAEIRKLAAGNVVWFQRRPKAARLLARLLGSSPAKLGLVLVLFEIQALDPYPDERGWHTHATCQTLEAAEDLAWSLLTRHGGEWRVRQGSRTIARGVGYRPGEPTFTHDRTATWMRVRRTHHELSLRSTWVRKNPNRCGGAHQPPHHRARGAPAAQPVPFDGEGKEDPVRITNSDDPFSIDDKRFYVPVLIEDACPACGETVRWDPSEGDYLSNPTANVPLAISMYHGTCAANAGGTEWEIEVVLRVRLEGLGPSRHADGEVTP